MHQSQASALLRDIGLPDGPLAQAYSNSNAVWMTSTHVIRAHIVGPAGRIAHEALVAQRLPAEAFYPSVVCVGWHAGHDWMIQERVPGRPLSAAWPTMSNSERRSAVMQVGMALRAIHSVDASGLSPPCQFGGVPVIPRLETANQAAEAFLSSVQDKALANEASARVNALAYVLDDDPTTIIHGDLNPNNVMWDGQVTAVIDLEMARREAPDVDLFNFISFCANPVRAVAEELEPVTHIDDYLEAPQWLCEAYPALCRHTHLKARLQLYELIALAVALQHGASGIRQHAERKLAEVIAGHSDVAAIRWER